MKWNRSLLLGLPVAATFALVAGVADGAQWPRLPGGDEAGATVWSPDPQWPRLPAEGSSDKKEPLGTSDGGLLWPDISAEAAEARRAIREARQGTAEPAGDSKDVTGSVGSARAPRPNPDVTSSAFGPQWPVVAPAGPPPLVVEIGGRYWFSNGTTRFGFTNGNPQFGNPTSTLDWNDNQGHTGELFGRIDHRPTGAFVKGLIGGGKLQGGEIIDRDFFVNQIEFSDTSSTINGNSVQYAVLDFGWAFPVPNAGVRLGVFAGYQFWRESKTAYGLICNPDDVGGAVCGPAGAGLYSEATAVGAFEPTWQALRIGFEARYQMTPIWSISGEVAILPVAWLENKDSHLLRQGRDELGPAPNIISRSERGYGATAELFVNCAPTAHLEIGVGARVWGLTTDEGEVRFGPDFATDYALTRFEQIRYGLLIQATGRF